MFERILLSGLLIALCTGVSCSISLPDDDGITIPGYVQLDRTSAELNIAATMSGTTSETVMSIRRNGLNVELRNGQEVAINDLPMPAPRADGLYARTLPRAATYLVRVSDPTLGMNETTLHSPADFTIDSPAAGQSVSLADGFTLTWSSPTLGQTTTIVLSQVLNSSVTEVLGPVADDAGTFQVTAAHLAKFRQGADITIRLTKKATITAIGGFAQAGGTLELSQNVSVVPAP